MTTGASRQLQRLYVEHHRKSIALVRRVVGDADEAEDVVHEVFCRLWVALPHFEGRSSLTTWLHRILVNASINWVRSRSRHARLQLPLSSVETPEALAIDREHRLLVSTCIDRLTDHHRQIVILRDVRGLSYASIAQTLRIPEGTVKSALNRARQQLKRHAASAQSASARYSSPF